MKKLLLILLTSTLSATGTCVRIGQGTIAPLHEKKLSEQGIQTIGVIDIDPAKTTFSSYEEAHLAKPDIWDICTPPETHLDVMKKIIALDPEARIIVEKPICMSQQVSDLEDLLKTFRGKIVVNENYLSSEVTKVVKLASQSLIQKPTRIIGEQDKNRLVDFERGRYIDSDGAFKYEGTHILTTLKSILENWNLQLPLKPDFKIYEDISEELKNQGSAHLQFTADDVQIVLYSSMQGQIKHSFPPHGRDTIQKDETSVRYRIIAVEGFSKEGDLTTVVGFYEPVAAYSRGVGEVVVLKNGKLDCSLCQVADDSMGLHLPRAARYLLGKTAHNPCPPEVGIEMVQLLDRMLPDQKN